MYHRHNRQWISRVLLVCTVLGIVLIADRILAIAESWADWPQLLNQSRTPTKQIEGIMAILAVFDEAQVLPPEGTSQATQLVHALIQYQSAFLTSTDPTIRQFFSQALQSYFFEQAPDVESKFYNNGWTSEILESVLLYMTYPGAWDDPRLDHGMQEFNVTRKDLYEIQVVFDHARQQFLQWEQDIHEVFRDKRLEMSGLIQRGTKMPPDAL